MKKRISSNWFWLTASVVLFVIYYFWFSAYHTRHLYSSAAASCTYKDGKYRVSIDYYNMQTKEEREWQGVIELADCAVIKISFDGKEWKNEPFELPVTLEGPGIVTAEDNKEGIYTIHILQHGILADKP